MPIHYEFSAQQRLLMTTMVGTVGDAEFLDTYAEILRNVDYSGCVRELVDVTGLTEANISAQALNRVAHMLKNTCPGCECRSAIVATSDLNFGLSRMYEAFAEMAKAEEVQVFRDRQEALTWLLGVDQPPV